MRKTLILSFDSEDDIGAMSNLFGHIVGADIHTFASEIGGLANEGMGILTSLAPYILTDSAMGRLERLQTILNEIDSRASLMED